MKKVHNSITILGAHGAKSAEGGSSSIWLTAQHVIDAGNLLLPLEEKSAQIETIWLTHSHLDHIADIAYILDNYYEERTKPLKIFALEETLEALKKHFFNGEIWPNFAQIPLCGSQEMTLTYHALNVEQAYVIEKGKTITPFLGDHSVPSVGYVLREGSSAIVISADTYALEHIVRMIEEDPTITACILECSFPLRMATLAKTSKHLTAAYLFDGIRVLQGRNLKLYINHIKPVFAQEIKGEIERYKGDWDVTVLDDGDTVIF